MLNFFGSSCFSAAISKKTACTSFSPVQTALSFSVFVFLFACFYIAALLVRADQLIAFFQHIAAALRAFLGRRFLPGHEIAFRIVFASIIFPSFFRLAQDHFFSALRTRNTDLFQIRLRVLAVRESRAGEEFSVRAVFDHHVAAAVLADDICHLILYLNFFEVLFCLCDRLKIGRASCRERV